MQVSCNFKVPVDYRSLYRYDTLKKIFPTEKLDLTWNEQTNFIKLCSLSTL